MTLWRLPFRSAVVSRKRATTCGKRNPILYQPFVPAGGYEATDVGQLSEKV
jgi:hypothetical protein